MRIACAVLILAGILSGWQELCLAVENPKNEVSEFIKIEKGSRGVVLTITGRIKSRHVRFRKGRSVRSYYIVTPDLKKISLPRSHVEHRDGTISGIYLKTLKSKDVELVCKGRVKIDEKKGLLVKVKKILSVKMLKP